MSLVKVVMIVGLVVATLGAPAAVAGTPPSWNLSRDMALKPAANPFGEGGEWTAMYDPSGASHKPVNYVAFTSFSENYLSRPWRAWLVPDLEIPRISVPTETFSFANGISDFVYYGGMPDIHPGFLKEAGIIRWTSPISGAVNISGSISDTDASCGDGIRWSVDKGGFTLMRGALANGGKRQSLIQQNVPVSIGTTIFFIIESGQTAPCDSTALDVLITAQ